MLVPWCWLRTAAHAPLSTQFRPHMNPCCAPLPLEHRALPLHRRRDSQSAHCAFPQPTKQLRVGDALINTEYTLGQHTCHGAKYVLLCILYSDRFYSLVPCRRAVITSTTPLPCSSPLH